MIPLILSFLPSTLCLAFMAFSCVFTARLRSCRLAVFMQLLCCIAFFTTASLYTDVTSDKQLLVMQLLSQLTVPALIPIALLYFRSFRRGRPQNPAGLLILLMPFALFVAELMFVAFLGHNESITLIKEIVHGQPSGYLEEQNARLLRNCLTTLFSILLAVEYIGLLVACFRVISRTKKAQKGWNAFVKGKNGISTSLLMAVNLILFFTLFLARYYVGILTDNVWLGVLLDLLLSIFVFLTFFNGMFEAKETVTLDEVLSAFRYNTIHFEEHSNSLHTTLIRVPTYTPVHAPTAVNGPSAVTNESAEAGTTAEGESAPSTTEEAATTDPISIMQQLAIEEDSLQRRFEEVMINDQLFLMPGITLSQIAERLNTNKTYLSRMINSTYNLAFPDYLNMLRIDYAEQYILHNHGVRQSEVAMACGFSSPSAFNNTFKKITGMTPKVWLATLGEKGKNYQKQP